MSFVDMTGWRMSQHGVEGSRVTVIKRAGTASDGHARWLCCCDCGKEFIATSNSLRKGDTKSCGCLAAQKRRANCQKLAEQHLNATRFIDMTGWVMKEHGVPGSLITVLYKTDKKCGSQFVWHCIDENGFEKDYPGTEIRSGVVCSCGSVSSRGELKVIRLLTDNKIPFQRQYKFKDCVDQRPLPFDFYVEEKYLIEYDGKQHFQECKWKKLDYVKKHDKIKNDYCKQHGIPLIRIPYTIYESFNINDLKLETTSFRVV